MEGHITSFSICMLECLVILGLPLYMFNFLTFLLFYFILATCVSEQAKMNGHMEMLVD